MNKDEVAKLVGAKLRAIRIESSLSIEALALESGIDYTQISRIELGKINTSLYQIYKLARTLNVSVSEITHVLP